MHVDLKQIESQLFLQQKLVYSGSAKNCNLESAHHMHVPTQQEEDNAFIEGKMKLGGL